MIDDSLGSTDMVQWEAEQIRAAVEAQFQPMFKIPRLFREIVITEKIDGTNAAILVNESGVFAGSKNRVLTPGKSTDNFGFAGWVEQNASDLASALGPGLHRGEWWGVGIQRGYGLVERRFSLFNTAKWTEAYNNLELPANVHVVPELYVGPFDTNKINLKVAELRDFGSVAVPGYLSAEGVIVFHRASQDIYKITCLNDDQYKGASNEKR